MEHEERLLGRLVRAHQLTWDVPVFELTGAPAPKRKPELKPRVMSRTERRQMIGGLAIKHSRRSGVSLATARDMLEEFQESNQVWRAQLEDVEPGLMLGIGKLDYSSQLLWWYLSKSAGFKALLAELQQACAT